MKTSLYSLRWSLTFPPPSVRFQGCRACIHVRARMYTRVHTCILSLFSEPLFNTHIDSVTSCGLGARSSLSTPELSVVPPPPRLFLCSHPSPNPSPTAHQLSSPARIFTVPTQEEALPGSLCCPRTISHCGYRQKQGTARLVTFPIFVSRRGGRPAGASPGLATVGPPTPATPFLLPHELEWAVSRNSSRHSMCKMYH